MVSFSVHIPTKELAKDFIWPKTVMPGTTEADWSKVPRRESSEEIYRLMGVDALHKLRGPYLMSALEAICSLLAIQNDREVSNDD